MKTRFSLIFISLFIIISGCEKASLPNDTPDCVKDAIIGNKNNEEWSVGSIEEYEFQGKTVYAFGPDTRRIADGSTEIYTSDCKRLCSVGGFGGPSVNLCNGENFFQKAVFKRTIWKKP